LIASEQPGAHWLDRLLEPRGYRLARVRASGEVLERAADMLPDIIALDADLSGAGALELCRALRGEGAAGAGTPMLAMSAEPFTREQRLAMLSAGAWECVSPPADADELVLRIDAFVRAKQECDRARLNGLTDPATGLYNRAGLARRARELGAQGFRAHDALACVVFAIDIPTATGPTSESTLQGCIQVFREEGRLSDVIARLGRTELAVLAPGTDSTGAIRMADRLARALRQVPARLGAGAPEVHVRAGYDAVGNLGYSPVQPLDLVVQAATALRTGAAERTATWIRRFDASAERRPSSS
jgi:diguanylate cyclase (GGDEF)-like protein